MISPDSRYAQVGNLVYTREDGTEVVYKARRFCPQGEKLPLLETVTVSQSDRLDLVAARSLGQAQLFWRVADANNAIDPFALTARPGRTLRIPRPRTEGPVPEL